MLHAVRNLTTMVPGLFALPEFGLAALFLLTWFQPTLLHPQLVAALVLLIMMEFVILHSSMILGALLGAAQDPLVKKVGVGVGIIYVAFAIGIAITSRQFWIIPAFALLTMNRLSPLLNEEPVKDSLLPRVLLPWVGSTIVYMGMSVVVQSLPIPHFGITGAVTAAQQLAGTGTLFEAPHAAVAMGFGYYLASGAWGFMLARAFADEDRRARDEQAAQSAKDELHEVDIVEERIA